MAGVTPPKTRLDLEGPGRDPNPDECSAGAYGGALSAIGLVVLYYALGHAVALFLVVLLVVVLVQFGKSFRNRRSRLKIYTWTHGVMFDVVLVGMVGALISPRGLHG